MRTLWRGFLRTIFWSYERGTWPYDVAVGVIVIFVLLSPRAWFHDRPPLGPPPNPAMVQFRGVDSGGTIQTFRVDSRVLSSELHSQQSELEHQLHEAVGRYSQDFHGHSFEIVRIEPIRAADGSIAYYDVSVKP